jgi:putative FmdB family regulatory protein
MPVYEYRCPECTRLFEKLVSYSQAARDADCPGCGARASKVLSTFAAIGASAASAGTAPAAPSAGGGGCCGGGCGGR